MIFTWCTFISNEKILFNAFEALIFRNQSLFEFSWLKTRSHIARSIKVRVMNVNNSIVCLSSWVLRKRTTWFVVIVSISIPKSIYLAIIQVTKTATSFILSSWAKSWAICHLKVNMFTQSISKIWYLVTICKFSRRNSWKKFW